MMIKHFLTICAAATAAAAGTSLAQAQQSYPVQQAPVYAPYPGAPSEYRPGDRVPNFDALEDDDDDAPHNSAALPPPGPGGPITSPNDPRYGRPAGAPVYSNNAPQGPVMSPDDPRYGRPAGPPAVTYADRPPQQPGDGLRPPEAVSGPASTGAVQQQQPAVG